MKKIFVIAALTLFLTACTNSETIDLPKGYSAGSLNEQTVEQLQLTSDSTFTANGLYTPLNYETQAAIWMTYMNYENILLGKSEEDFTSQLTSELENIKNAGFNTIYFHVSAFNDSYYKSEIYPRGKYFSADADFDPLAILTKEAHKLNISVHGWINPLRCMTDEEMKRLDEKYLIKQWYSGNNNGKYIVNTGDRWYLNPAYPKVREYIFSGVKEIVDKYDVDGIHIDDYFYPDTSEEFDSSAFSESGETDLASWRMNNINLLVSGIYDTVKSTDENLLFGISPQGNMEADYAMYADVKKWCTESGFCDYIVPQIYYGFENESCPFRKTVQDWRSTVSSENVKLIAGICTYKIGSEDKWAGSGKDEWIETEGIPAMQAAYTFENKAADGIAVYSYESTFKDGMDSEISVLSEKIREYTEGGTT